MQVSISTDIMLLNSIQVELMGLKEDLSKKLKSGLYAAHVEDGYRERIAQIDSFLSACKTSAKAA